MNDRHMDNSWDCQGFADVISHHLANQFQAVALYIYGQHVGIWEEVISTSEAQEHNSHSANDTAVWNEIRLFYWQGNVGHQHTNYTKFMTYPLKDLSMRRRVLQYKWIIAMSWYTLKIKTCIWYSLKLCLKCTVSYMPSVQIKQGLHICSNPS